jgi:hypothetical protein
LFLGFRGRDIADWCQQASVIEPIYPFQGGEFHGLEATPRPAPVNDLGLVKPVDGLGERVDAPMFVKREFELILLRRVRCRLRARCTFLCNG